MNNDNLQKMREDIRKSYASKESEVILDLKSKYAIAKDSREKIQKEATDIVKVLRSHPNKKFMERFMVEYDLSNDEGIALMCLAEALMRVPDAPTMNAIIEDKITPAAWKTHLGHSSSLLVNASTWALMITGKVLDDNSNNINIHSAIKRLGEPVIRKAVAASMKELGKQFVLGETIEKATKRQKNGYTFSYDMLGEASTNKADAKKYFDSYLHAINHLASLSKSENVADNPGISIKLSALYPRYEVAKREKVIKELLPILNKLIIVAKDNNIGLNIDAEEASKLDMSLDIIEAAFKNPELGDWQGFGVVVQAYMKRSSQVIDWLYALAKAHNRRMMVRLVKGAYWDSEIKLAQVNGASDFPVFTSKVNTDISYACCAKQLLAMQDYIYPQFATHNAHTIATILQMTDKNTNFELQKLHGMGENLHDHVIAKHKVRSRIYAPVGVHKDLLAYLVRRLLENGANSSFVNQIINDDINISEIAKDPFEVDFKEEKASISTVLKKPSQLYLPQRINSQGFDLENDCVLAELNKQREKFKNSKWSVKSIICNGAGATFDSEKAYKIINPANPSDVVGDFTNATSLEIEQAIKNAKTFNKSAIERQKILEKAADLFEESFAEIFAIIIREAGKSCADAISELREAVDFLRYYAVQAGKLTSESKPLGVVTCISPWNFPLAIFTGQIAAALAAGNAVIAKPAETAPIIASMAVKLMHKAGVPFESLQLIIGEGKTAGTKITSNSKIKGVCFTGSTETAQHINRSIANNLDPEAVLIAETGGINSMIVDSTALPEQCVKDIIASSFQSAGQRCSALRMLYLQEDIADSFISMLFGAMDELTLGDPWEISTDVGAVIDKKAKETLINYIDQAKNNDSLMKQLKAPTEGHFVPPSVIKVNGILDIEKEMFGPVLHIATFAISKLDQVISDINKSGYGLTFGLHSRIDSRAGYISKKIKVGNFYVNRNQIGAVVETQPFGGENLSGTGPKAGGPNYVKKFLLADRKGNTKTGTKISADINQGKDSAVAKNKIQSSINKLLEGFQQNILSTETCLGPTGEANHLYSYSKGLILCLGPSAEEAEKQASIAKEKGCLALKIVPDITDSRDSISGFLDRSYLTELEGFVGVALWSNQSDQQSARKFLSLRKGSIIPIDVGNSLEEICIVERHVCINTTASGGNIDLLKQLP